MSTTLSEKIRRWLERADTLRVVLVRCKPLGLTTARVRERQAVLPMKTLPRQQARGLSSS